MAQGRFTAGVKGVVAGVVLTALAGPAQAQSNPHDGRWEVEVVTEKGTCDQAFLVKIKVERGAMTPGGTVDFQIAGGVAANGRVNATLRRGTDTLSINGSVAGARGAGRWVARERGCEGRWRADRAG